eukprot:TRINITY_DN8474_c0_g1_i1.p1 TRINITY_DN8474_c0_g1~~TRINITY_DN8474_c0_g1_i1.p1  ORF type:complete len:229 (+),score=60.91 TRINITY_DN8474_c0_g1_i1:442-1128(+)
MFLYLFGVIVTELNALSFAWVHLSSASTEETFPYTMLTALALLTFWCLEYNMHEWIHTFTYDIFDENVGFKLTWGCTCFYPFFYPITIIPFVDLAAEGFTMRCVASIVCFFVGYLLSRGANNQKWLFKVEPTASFLGIKPIAIGGRLLISGWWGLSRHINYLGEILMAIGLAIPAGMHSWWPWLYPIYYVVLLLARERDDDDSCRIKYGSMWDEYCNKVPYRVIPYVY